MIHNSAVIDPNAKIAKNVEIGPWSYIGPNVEIDEGTKIGAHVIIRGPTKIGKNNKIYDYAALGGDAQVSHFDEEPTYLEIGDENIVREYATINRGTKRGGGITKLGNHNFIMTYCHIAHDCQLGNHVIMANYAGLAGHVIVGDYAAFSAYTGVHQNVTIGTHCFLGRSTKVVQDIPPYVLVVGNPGAPHSLNLVGLKRRGFSEETVRKLRRAYSIVYRQGKKLNEAIAEVENMAENCPELKIFLEALQNLGRGLAR